MKIITRLSLLLAVLSISTICSQSNNNKSIIKEISVASFESLDIEGAFTVIIEQGDKESLFVQAENDMMKLIKADVKNNTLQISLNTGFTSSMEFEEIKLLITVKDLKQLDLDGFIELNVSNTLNTDKLNLNCKGATKGIININTKILVCEVSSFSELILIGFSDSLTLQKTDASSIDASQLNAESVSIEGSGFGKVDVMVENNLTVKISGAVKVTYAGDPNVKDIKQNGFSSLSKVK